MSIFKKRNRADEVSKALLDSDSLVSEGVILSLTAIDKLIDEVRELNSRVHYLESRLEVEQ